MALKMTYDVFLENAKAEFLKYTTEHPEITITHDRIYKTNVSKDTFIVKNADYQEMPYIYANDMYDYYLTHGNISDTVQQFINTTLDAIKNLEDNPVDLLMDTNYVLEHLFIKLINTAQNTEILSRCPNKIYEDLSTIYCIALNEDFTKYITINNEILNHFLKMKINELHDATIKSMEKHLPAKIINLSDLFSDMPDLEPDASNVQMWILSNHFYINGASAILCEGALDIVCDKADTDDLFVLPSSVHEVICLPKVSTPMNLHELASMVYEINAYSVRPEERLSNNVYSYHRGDKEIKLATNFEKPLLLPAENLCSTKTKKI